MHRYCAALSLGCLTLEPPWANRILSPLHYLPFGTVLPSSAYLSTGCLQTATPQRLEHLLLDSSSPVNHVKGGLPNGFLVLPVHAEIGPSISAQPCAGTPFLRFITSLSRGLDRQSSTRPSWPRLLFPKSMFPKMPRSGLPACLLAFQCMFDIPLLGWLQISCEMRPLYFVHVRTLVFACPRVHLLQVQSLRLKLAQAILQCATEILCDVRSIRHLDRVACGAFSSNSVLNPIQSCLRKPSSMMETWFSIQKRMIQFPHRVLFSIGTSRQNHVP